MGPRQGVSFALLTNVVSVSALTCGEVNNAYHNGQCCGDATRTFDERTLYQPADDCVNYAFALEDLPQDQNLDFVPAQECFYPVTLPAFIDAGLVNYSWVPHSNSNEHAPSGAYVYQTSSGGVLYKKITSVPVETEGALVFGCAHGMPRTMNPAEAQALGTAAQCFQAPISLTNEPFTSYTNFFWVQMPWMNCGAFVYETENDGPLMFHTCDSPPADESGAGDDLCPAVADPSPSTAAVTCGKVGEAYFDGQCTGDASREFDEQALYQPAADCVDYAFTLEDLPAEQNPDFEPAQECFYPVTLPAFIDAGLVSYSWVPHSRSNEHAPSGAYVYQTSSGGLLYKKITSVPVETEGALVFSCAHAMPRATDAAEAQALGTAAQCFDAPISLTNEPFTSYTNFFWVQMPWMECGAFVYQTGLTGPLTYHTCDTNPPAPTSQGLGGVSDLCPPTGEGLTCGAINAAYQNQQCSGDASRDFDVQHLHQPAADCVDYAFTLEDLPAEQNPDFEPAQECFYPVTLPAFIDAGLVSYSWVPHSRSNEHAPSGAYVYQTSSGGLLYKKITSVPVETEGALVFSCAHVMPSTTTLSEANVLGMAAQCTEAPISLTSDPFTSYTHFFWAQMPWMDCGAFVYQTQNDGPLMYHTCDAPGSVADPEPSSGGFNSVDPDAVINGATSLGTKLHTFLFMLFTAHMKPSLALPMAALFALPSFGEAVSCGDVQAAYQSEQCCGASNQAFDERTLYKPADDCVNYAFALEDLPQDQNLDFVPAQECFYPVTLPAFIDAGLVNYSWVPHSNSNEHAPSGAYVYQRSSGGVLYKKITSVPVETEGALVFSCAHTMPRMMNVQDAQVLGTAARCFDAPISLTSEPFTSYTQFSWVQMPSMSCGAFVYQTQNDGPLMYHTCDAPGSVANPE